MASPRIRTAWANRNTHESLLRRWRRSLAYACSPVTDLCRATRSYRPTPICHRNSRLSWNFRRHSISFCQNSTRMNWTSCRHRSNSLQVNPPRTEPRCFYKSDVSRWTLVAGASPHATVCGTQRMRSTVYSGVSDKIPTGLSEHS